MPMSSRETVLSVLKAALELTDSVIKGIHPGIEAITGVPLKLIEYYEVSRDVEA